MTCTRLSGLRMLAWEVPVERHSIPCPSIVALSKSAAQEMLQRVSGSRACGWGFETDMLRTAVSKMVGEDPNKMEAAYCGLLGMDLAAGIRRVKRAKRAGVRLGN